jgi:hypothetical protein
VQLAFSKRRDSHISAGDARPEDGPFLCMNPDCRRLVTLHRTSPNYHFQHARGKGSPECSLFGGRLELTVRTIAPARREVSSRPPRSRGPVLLFSGDTPGDFSLDVRLPDTDPARPWAGTIVVHERGERRVQFERVRYGVSHMRPQQNYRIECKGDVDLVYRALIDATAVGLDQELNVFPYSTHGVEQLESGRALRCDKQYWIISRHEIAQSADCTVAAFSTQPWLGWWVSSLRLPSFTSLSSDQVRSLEAWVQRPLAPESSRVIIRTPQPHHFLDSGIAVFPVETELLILEAREQTGLRLECDGIARGAVESLDDLGLYACRIGGPGRWTVFNGSRALLAWEVRVCPVFNAPSITLISKESHIDLFHPDAASFISNAGNRREQIDLRVSDPRLFALVEINGHSPVDEPNGNLLAIDPQTVRSISAANFGRLEIVTAAPDALALDSRRLAFLKGRSRWLQGVSSISYPQPSIAMSGRPREAAPPWVKTLARARWPGKLAPHVRALARDLHQAGVWHVS